MADYITAFPGREVFVEGKPYLYFGGTAYLGLQTHPEFLQLYGAQLLQYGPVYGASRNANLRIAVFEEAEAMLAKWVGSEACITLSSGYLAGQFLIDQLKRKEGAIFYAPNTHSALMGTTDKCEGSYAALEIALKSHLAQNPDSSPIVVLDAIDFSGSHYPDFRSLRQLPLHQCILVADDSHGIGIVGKEGSGVYQQLVKFGPKELLVCCSLAKGLALPAGAIFGAKNRLDAMRNDRFFAGASPAAPAAMGTLVQARPYYDSQRTLLQRNILRFSNEISHLDKFRQLPEHPSISFTDTGLNAYLRKSGILITNFKYPDTASDVTSRLVLSAAHRPEDIDQLIGVIKAYYK